MRLTKHHGLGNDFLVVLDPASTHPLDAEVARTLCDRHTGVGADGILRATPAAPDSPAMARMELRNADGSPAEMSGNGIRCFAQALVLGGWPYTTDAAEIPIDTDAGLRTVTVHDELTSGSPRPLRHSLSVEMGAAVVEGDAPEWAGGAVARALRVNMGNPHLVLDVTRAAPGEDVDLVAVGESANAKVPGGVNVHLLAAGPGGDAQAIAVRTYERGVGPTLACGTGACAAAAAARRWGMVGSRVVVEMPGGQAEVTLGAQEGDPVVLRAPAAYVAEIELGDSPWR
jgi:diaminopimelate epimerase